MELRNHWIRILILISYFFLVFVIARILDLVLWCHHGYLPTDLVDPIVLNVRQLKQLLDSRGISYTGVLEKPQLVELLNDSATVLKSELDEVVGRKHNISQDLPHSIHFTGGSHFNEKVEDTKDSVWLVQVLPMNKRKEPLLDDYSWRYLKYQLAPFAIQTGVFDCALDRELCIRRNWLEPILLLALPRGNRPKDHVVIQTSKTPKIHIIIKWVKDQLSSRVVKITTPAQLEEDWLHPSFKSDGSVRVVLLSHLLHTPLFFAALSIKFSGRIKFGMFSVQRDEDSSDQGLGRRKLAARYPLLSPLPAYLVITPEGTHRYGHLPAEHLNLLHMNLFLKLVVPEINDIFLVALLLTNMLALIDVCQMRSSSRLIYLLVHTLLRLIGYNLTLFSLSLLFYNVSLPLSSLVSLLRYLNFSYLGGLIRSDLLSLYAHPLLFAWNFLSFSFYAGKIFPCKETTSWDFFPFENSLFNFLFRPTEPPSQLFTSDVHFDIRFEQFVLRAPRITQTPNLWLQTTLPRLDYISDLPVFEYKGWRACPHKEMKMICRVMDGEEPVLLRGGKVVGNNRRAIDANTRNTEQSSSTNNLRDTDIVSAENINTDALASVSNARYRSSGIPSSRLVETHSPSCERSDGFSSRGECSQNVASVSDAEDLNIPNEATNSIVSSTVDTNIPHQAGTSVRRRMNVGASASRNSCDCNSISSTSSSIDSHSNISNSSSTGNSTATHLSKRRRTSTSEVIHTRESFGDNLREVNTSRFGHYNVNSRSNECTALTTQDVSTRDDTGDCNYLECRLIRSKDCAICLETYVQGTLLLALPCAHHYHKSCILPWLQRVAQCPVCRWPAYDQKYDFAY